MITLDPAMTGGRAVRQAFERKGLEPRVVMRAADADVAKAYVELGLGIAVLPGVAYDRRRDPGLRAIEASALFGTGTLVMALHPHAYLLGFLYEFIALVSPEWTRAAVDERLAAARPRSPVET